MYHHHQPSQPTPSSAYSSMSTASPIQGGHLEVTVVGCTKLKDTEWISRQDPYVSLQYGTTKFRTRTCTDGHKNPTFQEKFSFSLIEGLREINIQVWNSNTLTMDDFIGSGKIHLQKVLAEGFDDNSWTIHTKSGRYAGEVRLIMHYANSLKPAAQYTPSAPPHAIPSTPLHAIPSTPHVPLYSAPPPYTSLYPTPVTAYCTPTTYSSYLPSSSSPYPPNPYPPPPQPYAAAPYSAYPPPPSSGSPYYPPGKGINPGVYPPPPPPY